VFGPAAFTVGDFAAGCSRGEQSSRTCDGAEVLPLSARGGVPSKGESPRFGKISPVYVFKLPLGHEYWCDFPKTDTA
jgi:hypothetical protein